MHICLTRAQWAKLVRTCTFLLHRSRITWSWGNMFAYAVHVGICTPSPPTDILFTNYRYMLPEISISAKTTLGNDFTDMAISTCRSCLNYLVVPSACEWSAGDVLWSCHCQSQSSIFCGWSLKELRLKQNGRDLAGNNFQVYWMFELSIKFHQICFGAAYVR